MTIMSSARQYHIVSGAQLPSFMGKNVSLVGTVCQRVSSGNTSFTINTTDNVNLKVVLNKPLDQDLDGGYIEVRGVCENTPGDGKSIKAVEYFTFNNKSFDAKGHTMLCKFLNSTPNVYSSKRN